MKKLIEAQVLKDWLRLEWQENKRKKMKNIPFETGWQNALQSAFAEIVRLQKKGE